MSWGGSGRICVDCGREATYATCEANPGGGLHRVQSEASSHATSSKRLLGQAIADFETPRSVALSCLGKHPDQIMRLLLDCADVAVAERGFEKGGPAANMRALRYAAEAIEWLWQHSEHVALDRSGWK